MERSPRVAIIGAGIAGIACARYLEDSGLSPVVFEKSAGVGGRLATRRATTKLAFDHGAQYFTARSAGFRKFLDTYCADKVTFWRPQGAGDAAQAHHWLVSAPAMTEFLKQASSGLDLRLDTPVTDITRTEDGWQLDFSGAAEAETFDMAVITAPAEQAMALTSFSDRLQASLSSIRMSPCWALMLALEAPSDIAQDIILDPSAAISWLARNSSKPGRSSATETWVAHASTAWSEQNFALDTDSAAQRLVEEVLACLGLADTDVAYAGAHRWRFAKVEHPAGEAFLTDETGTLFVCGDGCVGPRVEAAFQSASALAAFISPGDSPWA